MNNIELETLVGGAWKIAATKAIKEYSQKELQNEMMRFIVIS